MMTTSSSIILLQLFRGHTQNQALMLHIFHFQAFFSASQTMSSIHSKEVAHHHKERFLSVGSSISRLCVLIYSLFFCNMMCRRAVAIRNYYLLLFYNLSIFYICLHVLHFFLFVFIIFYVFYNVPQFCLIIWFLFGNFNFP